MNHRIVVIETDHLRSSPALLNVVEQMMVVHINQIMVDRDQEYPFLIIVDKAWKLLQGKASGAFVDEVGQTFCVKQFPQGYRFDKPALAKGNTKYSVTGRKKPPLEQLAV